MEIQDNHTPKPFFILLNDETNIPTSYYYFSLRLVSTFFGQCLIKTKILSMKMNPNERIK